MGNSGPRVDGLVREPIDVLEQLNFQSVRRDQGLIVTTLDCWRR